MRGLEEERNKIYLLYYCEYNGQQLLKLQCVPEGQIRNH